MENSATKLIEVIKQQAEAFLLEMGEFYPFGAYINDKDVVKPLAAYLEDEQLSATELFIMLQNYIHKILYNGECKIAAIAIDVSVKENGQVHDAMQIELFQQGVGSSEKILINTRLKESK